MRAITSTVFPRPTSSAKMPPAAKQQHHVMLGREISKVMASYCSMEASRSRILVASMPLASIHP